MDIKYTKGHFVYLSLVSDDIHKLFILWQFKQFIINNNNKLTILALINYGL